MHFPLVASVISSGAIFKFVLEKVLAHKQSHEIVTKQRFHEFLLVIVDVLVQNPETEILKIQPSTASHRIGLRLSFVIFVVKTFRKIVPFVLA